MSNEAMIECDDGIERPAEECVQTHDERWLPADECVEIDGAFYSTSEDDICYVESRGEWFHTEDCTLVGDCWEHDDDCVICQSCRDAILEDNACSDPSGNSVCESCYDDQCGSCSECGDCCWNEDLDEDGCCSACQSPRLIACYSDKTANHLRSETRDKLRFGVELEVEGYESAEEAAEYVRQFLTPAYCVLKRDGSLGEAGVEIVTRPDSMAVHRREFGRLFADSPGRALSSWNTGRCGMHVHISRSALSQLQIGKMLCFLNEPAAMNFISKIAGRKPCHWCKAHKKKISDCRHDHDRYSALNVTGSRTVEVRIFKGTLAESGFLKNLEFVEALVEFTAPGSRSISQATSHRAFCDWLPKKQYPHLHQFLVSKGFIRRRRSEAA